MQVHQRRLIVKIKRIQRIGTRIVVPSYHLAEYRSAKSWGIERSSWIYSILVSLLCVTT